MVWKIKIKLDREELVALADLYTAMRDMYQPDGDHETLIILCATDMEIKIRRNAGLTKPRALEMTAGEACAFAQLWGPMTRETMSAYCYSIILKICAAIDQAYKMIG